jgi:cyclopropane-fatty-acyl-phospholipid synthase
VWYDAAMLEKMLLDKILQRIVQGGVRVTYWDGDSRVYGGLPDPALHVTLTDKKLVRAIAKNISLGVGEAYMDGKLLVDGPLDQLAALAYDNPQAFDIVNSNRLHKGFHRNNRRNQPKLIAHHYDLGNDFYELWLDTETLGYTCGYYKTPQDTLEQGQVQKFDHVLNKLQIKPGQELLDIGFGWGYLLIRAAKRYGIKGVGVSLSREQHAYACEWAKREGVEKLVAFELMNYQDLPKLKRQFDRVVSIGFFEHVGRGNHQTYFDTVNKMLRPDGISVLHCITQQQEAFTDAWLDRYIFPGGYVPSIREVTARLPSHDFILKDYENIGPHYIPTLEAWWQRFEANKQQVIGMYDERFYRMWRLYLASSIAAFRTGTYNLSQYTFARKPGLDWPLTRAYLYK